MSLKAFVKSLEEVSESARAFYVEDGNGGFKLDAEGVEDVTGLKNSLTAVREELKTLKADYNKYKDLDPEKAREALRKMEDLEDKGLMDAGKVDELVSRRTERMRMDFDSQVKALKTATDDKDTTIKALSGRLEKHLIEQGLLAAVMDVGVPRKSALTDITSRGKGTWKLDENGNPMAVGSDGSKIFGKDGKAPITMTEWAEGLMVEAPHLFEPSTGGPNPQKRTKVATGGDVHLSPTEKLKMSRQ